MLGPEDYRSVLHEDGGPAVTLVEEADVACLEDGLTSSGVSVVRYQMTNQNISTHLPVYASSGLAYYILVSDKLSLKPVP
ncbi:hypothetical protein LXL04_024123 [Taraxacum kok-saghyz]